MYSIQQYKTIMVKGTYDVIVVGGGFAGVAAALAAARQGQHVLLIEREYILGGLGTAGLVTYYLPICDGMGRQVCYGIAEELLRSSILDGAEGRYPKAWLEGGTLEEKRCGQRFMTQYNPHFCAIQMERLLLGSGVELLYGTMVCDIEIRNNRIEVVIIENKSGRSAMEAGAIIDCSGDADIAYMAGVPTTTSQAKNPLAAWYYFLRHGKIFLNGLGTCDVHDHEEDTQYQQIGGAYRISGLDSWENSQMVQKAHMEMYKDILDRRNRGEECVPVTIPTIPQLRMTRRIIGRGCVIENFGEQNCEDSVGLFPDWTTRGPVYELPFGALSCENADNLLVAGRCLSASDVMWNITRVIPVCAVSGEAAGTASGLTHNFRQICIDALQNELRKEGIRIHKNELGRIC